MGITGDFKRLRQLSSQLRQLKSPSFARGLSIQLAEEARDLVVKCLDSSVDPYGKPYARLKYRKGVPLEKTGRLRNSITYTASTVGFSLLFGVLYAAFHNRGTPSIPRRQFVPTRGLPAAWGKAFVDVGDAYIQAVMK